MGGEWAVMGGERGWLNTATTYIPLVSTLLQGKGGKR